MEFRTRVQGEDHPDTLRARGNLTVTLREIGELDQARTLGEQLLAARTRLLGEEHSQTLGAMADLAVTLLAQGNGKEAISLLTKGLEAALRVFGKKHAVTTEAAWRLVENCGRHEAARQRALIVRYLSWLSHEQPAG